MVVVFLMVAEESLLNEKVNNIKFLNNCLTAIQRIQGKIAQNQWAEAISLFLKFKPEILSRNVISTPKTPKSAKVQRSINK